MPSETKRLNSRANVLGIDAFCGARLYVVKLSMMCSTCHWCHVMERESFESQEVAEVINERFVSIKVDREERPDVDRVYVRP